LIMSDPGRRAEESGLESLAAQLRSLPEPLIPDGLEARLLAAIPAATAQRRAGRPYRKPLLWLTAVAVVAASLLFAVLAWRSGREAEHAKNRPIQPTQQSPAFARENALPPEAKLFMELRWDAATAESRRDGFHDLAAAPFTWPLEVPVTTLDQRRLTSDLFH
jgi:hypothetical protein